MTTLFDATVSRKPARRFGAGLLASRPSYRASFTASDEAWLIADNARREAENRHLDALYAASVEMDRMFAGPLM